MFSSSNGPSPQHVSAPAPPPGSIYIPPATSFTSDNEPLTATTISPTSPQIFQNGGATASAPPSKPKQKRNKPTLSCGECVERKTKCDRGRPVCMACVKRQTKCEYSAIANMLASSEFAGYARDNLPGTQDNHLVADSSTFREKPAKIRRMSKNAVSAPEGGEAKFNIKSITQPPPPSNPAGLPPQHLQEPMPKPESVRLIVPSHREDDLRGWGLTKDQLASSQSPRNSSREPAYRPRPKVHLTSLAMDNSAPISIFGVGREHPFGNYWTSNGGLPEVVAVMPSKPQADILMSKFFEIVDPMFPVIDRFETMSGYQHFWSLPEEDRGLYSDPTTVALHFVLYANATLFIEHGHPQERTRTAEFYISAAHQALRLSSYWSHISLTTVMAMCMTFHFLINDNHVHDAWVFAGIMTRQSQVLQLNRDPKAVVPDASTYEHAARLKLWTLLMFQDTGVALFLKLPPTSIHTDITPGSFEMSDQDHQSPLPGPHPGDFPISQLDPATRKMDLEFLQCVWKIGVFMQKNICLPRSIGQHLCRSQQHRLELVNSFRAIWHTFPHPFNSQHPERFMENDPRLAKQMIYISNTFYHPMMLILSDTNEEGGVQMDVFGTLEAAHEALSAFFAMHEMFGSELNGFWSMQHRSFEVALTMANLLAKVQAMSNPQEIAAQGANMASASWLLARAKEDVRRMLDVIRASSGYFEFQTMEETRLDALRSVFQKISIS